MGRKKTAPRKGFSWFRFLFIWVPLFFVLNWVFHAIRKPSEVLGLLDTHFYKTPAETWKEHGDDFRRFSTSTLTPEFLAALAQAETQGNPIARTYWRWKLSWNPFEIYSPASTAVGLYQITDGTFENLKGYCFRDGRPVEGRCGSFLKSRLIAEHAIEMTASYLHLSSERMLTRLKGRASSRVNHQALAATIHLCGEGVGARFVRSGFRSQGIRCGDHRLSRYLVKVQGLQATFRALAR